MLLTEFAALVREYTGTSTSTLPDARIIRLANPQMEQLANRITDADPKFFGKTLTRDLVAGEREYSLPSDILSAITKVEVKIDGTVWKDIAPMELSGQKYATDEADIQKQFRGRNSRYAIYGQNLVIYSELPITDVDEGIKFLCALFPTKLTNLTDNRDLAVPADDVSQGFPRPFHEILARKVSIVWKQNQDRPIALTDYEQNVEKAILEALAPMQAMVEAMQAEETEVQSDDGREY